MCLAPSLLELRRKIVVVVKSSLAGEASTLRFQLASSI